MAGINWKYEAPASACKRFWAGLKERYTEEGLSAPPGAQCPYPETSFAALHWRRGAAARPEREVRDDGKAAIARILETL